MEISEMTGTRVVGFTKDFASKWEPFAIFPGLEYDRIVYYQGRTYYDDPGMSTKRFPNRTEAPLSSKYWIYNIDALNGPGVRMAVVVESILNVLSLQKQFNLEGVTDMVPVCVFKHLVSHKLCTLGNQRDVLADYQEGKSISQGRVFSLNINDNH